MGFTFPLTFPLTFEPAVVSSGQKVAAGAMHVTGRARTSAIGSQVDLQAQREQRLEIYAILGAASITATAWAALIGSRDDGLLLGFVCMLCCLQAMVDAQR